MIWKQAIAAVAVGFALAPALAPVGAAQAQTIGAVENARAKERQGSYLSPQDRENLHRYGGNDDYGRRYGYDSYGYNDGDYDGGAYSYGPAYGPYSGYPY
jgi:hypothetical protein